MAAERDLVLLLCGLPGAGKSTVAARIERDGADVAARLGFGGAGQPALQVACVSFDRLLEAESRRAAATRAAPPAAAAEREGASAAAGTAAEVSPARSEAEFDVDAWHRHREAAWQAVRVALEAERAPRSVRLVVVDDNFHLRSMRKHFYQLSRSCGALFVQWLLDVPRGVAEARNRARPQASRVPDKSLERIATSFEPPDAAKHAWERLSFVVRCEEARTEDELWRKLLPWDALARLWRVERPEPPPSAEEQADAAAQREADREQNRRSVLHRLDIELRRVVHEALAACPRETRADLARRVAAKKHEVLAAAHRGSLEPELALGEMRALCEGDNA
jgi:O-phosphoseryl-tRNA(Sec) kinase